MELITHKILKLNCPTAPLEKQYTVYILIVTPQAGSCTIEVKPQTDSLKVTIPVNNEGQFCTMLAPGQYQLQVIIISYSFALILLTFE